jgi:hypothetical protein
VLEQRKILNFIDETNERRHLLPRTNAVSDLTNKGKEADLAEIDKTFGFELRNNAQIKTSASLQLPQNHAKNPLPFHRKAFSDRGKVMYIDSFEFQDWISELEEIVTDQMGNHFICLTCWCFVDLHQKLQHQRYMHVCPEQDAITDRDSFLHYAKIFNQYHKNSGLVLTLQAYNPVQVNRIMVVHPTAQKGIRNVRLKRGPKESQFICDNLKGIPPCLQDPLVPLEMVPFNDQELIETPVHDPTKLQFGWQTISRKNKYFKLNQLFDTEETF